MVRQDSALDLRNGEDVVREDMEYICGGLADDFAVMSGKDLLITGGAGFLGYYLVKSVDWWNQQVPHAERIRVHIYDNFALGSPSWLVQLSAGERVQLVEHDVSRPLPADMGDFQYIIHAASIASPTFYRLHPIETMDANVNGIRALLEYCRHQAARGKEVGGLLFFSSSEVYGDPTPENIPTPESYWGHVSFTGPRSCYDESKRYGEALCANFHRRFDVPVKAVRPFNNYGPGLKSTDRRVIADFARDVLHGRDIVMHSDGGPTRTFCYVADAVVGYYKALVRGLNGHAYNIGIEAPEVSIGQLAEHMAVAAEEVLGWTGQVLSFPSENADYLVHNPQRRCPSIVKARSELGYSPSVSLDEGLRRALLWYRDLQAKEQGL